MRLCLPMSSAYVGGIRKLVVLIPILDVIFMGYCMLGQVSTVMSIAIYKSKFKMGEKCLGGSS